PRVAPTPPAEDAPSKATSGSHPPAQVALTRLADRLDDELSVGVPPGAVGIARALRAWGSRRYGAESPRWSTDRMANLIGYRIVELAEAGRMGEATDALRLVADAI